MGWSRKSRKKEWPKRYRTVRQLAEGLASGEIPPQVVSPGAAAAALDCSRQAVHDQIKRGTLHAWIAEGRYVLVDVRGVRRKARERLGIPETQGELDVGPPM
jgi:hypothetical protein